MGKRGRKKLVLTEAEIEERKAKKKKYHQEYRAKNIERDKIQKAKWKANNKDYFQKYYQDNKEYLNKVNKETYNSDKEKWKKINRANLNKHNTGEYHVYKIDSAKEYVGLTTNMYTRMSRHKHDGRDTSNVKILSSFSTYKEARELESFLHQLGYPGDNKLI